MPPKENHFKEDHIRQQLEERKILPRKINILFIAVIIFLTVATVTGTILFLEINQQKEMSFLARDIPTPSSAPISTANNNNSDKFNTSDWKDYKDQTLDINFKAPSDLKVTLNQSTTSGDGAFYIQDYPFGAPPPDNFFKMEVVAKKDKVYSSADLEDLKKDLFYPQDKNLGEIEVLSGITVDRKYRINFIVEGSLFEILTTQRNDKNTDLTDNIVSTFTFMK